MTTDTNLEIRMATIFKEAGMEPRIAEVQAEEMETIIHGDVATREDLKKLRDEMKTEMNALGDKLKLYTFTCMISLGAILMAWTGLLKWMLG